MKDMKHKPELIGALQAAGLVAYIILVASIMQTVSGMMPEHMGFPILGASFFLLLFVTSALICGTIALGYPIMLFFMRDKKREALDIVAWTIGYLVTLAMVGIFAVAMIPFW